MYKRIGLISIFLIVGVWVVIFFGFSNKITAEIPSATSYVLSTKDWTIHFSKAMDPDTFNENTVLVTNKNGDRIATEMEWNDSFSILTLRAPKEGYSINEEYEIIISDVLSASGDKLSKELKHNFTAMADLPTIKNQKQLITLLKERIKNGREEKFSLFSSDESESFDMDTGAGESSGSSPSSGDDSSSTNVQVQGIDEADIIKTDGQSIFFVRDGDIIIASTDKTNSKILSQIKLENFYPQEIYVQHEMLITIGQKSEPLREVKKSTNDIGIPEPTYYSQTTILIYDITNPERPKQIREVSQEGYYSTSRILDGYLYLIANEHPPYHILSSTDDVEVRPFIKDSAVGEKSMPVDFDNMYFFPESKEEQFLILTSIDLNNMEKEANIETYLGASNQVYMSHNNLYVAVNKYTEKEPSDIEDTDSSNAAADIMIWRPVDTDTEITQFNVENGTLTYNASVLVNGTLINQFAMDERNNTFRVATTKGNTWDSNSLSTNNLYTFDINLNPLGSVEGLAEGERIYSVRFMDQVAYMVTFKEMDPLFVIDLKDPTKPTVLGELKIPGFSNYLHPLDENHVIGFGQDTKLINEGENEPWVQTDGIKISVFDVSDPTNPKEKYSEVIGQGGSYSELLHNHKVLFKHPTENLFGFPAVLYETKTIRKNNITYEDYKVIFEGALLYEITPTGIQLIDTITHQAELKEYPEWTSEVRRIVSVDNTIYTFSLDKMKVYDMNQKQVLKTVDLPELSFEY